MKKGDREDWTALEVLGQRIRQLREERGLKQGQLAARSQMHPNAVWLIENGRRNPTAKTLLALSAALNIHPAELWADFSKADLKKLF